ncbi:MAG: ATP-dependent DNA ligase [Planctomycetes bacterium]|nr:ATP-dependent DNA ligase [Planctomycetota bacterium]
MSPVLDKSRVEILLGQYGTAPATALADSSLLPKVQEYRRLASGRMQPLDREGMTHKIPVGEYYVSRKVDGEFTVLILREGLAFSLNPGGTVRVGLPWLDEAARLLSKAGVKDAMIAGELYVARDDKGRPRVHDVCTVARNPQSAADLKKLRFAAFDVMARDGAVIAQPFAETWKLIQKWFGAGELAHAVESRTVKTIDEIQKLFETWVEQEGAEGIVARSDAAGQFKVKPRHTLDLAVLGYTESTDERQGMLHDLLLGVKRADSTLQVLGRVGGGFTDDQRREMLSDLKDMAVDSEYAEVNGDNVAYQMVNPEWVMEVSCLDLLSSTTRGGSINRMVLDYRNNGTRGYQVVTKLPLATIISPQFIRRREDKHVRPEDCGITQVSNIVEVPLIDRDARQMTLPHSEILRREVYTKDLKGQTMVRKFLMWKTNKETGSDEFPAYVVHFTDFSPNRKDALARELRVSNSQTQIEQLWEVLKADNIKAGWNALASSVAHATAAPAAAAQTSEEPAEKPKKKAATKKTASESDSGEQAPVKKSAKKKKAE